jgi:hypothetical protein
VTIGILKITLFIHNSNSLKEKRMVMQSLKTKLRNNFNIAVTQIDDEDKWQKSYLAVVGVEKDNQAVNSILSRVINYIEGFSQVNLIDYAIELI